MAGGSGQEIAEIEQRLALIEAHLEQVFTHLQVRAPEAAALDQRG